MKAHELATDRLVHDLESVAHDTQELLKATAGEVGEKAREARARLSGAIERAKESCERLQEKAVEGAKAADHVVREHPYQSIGVAFGLGLLIGVLVTRR